MRNGRPFASWPFKTTARGRSTSTLTVALPSERQPSSIVSVSSLADSTSGLTTTRAGASSSSSGSRDPKPRPPDRGRPDHHPPPQRPDLRRRQPGTVGALHHRVQFGDLLRERGVEALHRP